MKRDDPDAFSPHTEKWTPSVGKAPLGFPTPGPNPDWSAEAVIETLEPLVLEERQERLKEVLEGRLDSVVCVLDNPHDPHNGSAIIRSCDAFGIQRLHLLCQHEEFLTSRNVAKGTHRWVDLLEYEHPESLVEALRKQRYTIVTTHPKGNLELSELSKIDRLALVLGNERGGVSQPLAEASDETVRIEMTGFVESLNVSVSAALCLHAATTGRAGDLSPEQRENVYARWLRASVPRADEILTS